MHRLVRIQFLEEHNLLDHDCSSVRPQVEQDSVISRNDIVRDEWELVVLELGWRNKRLIQPNRVTIFLIDGPISVTMHESGDFILKRMTYSAPFSSCNGAWIGLNVPTGSGRDRRCEYQGPIDNLHRTGAAIEENIARTQRQPA